MPPNRARHPGNQPIVNMLEDERHTTDSENRKATLHRAIRSILTLDYPITSKADALQVHCVGSVIATKIDVFLRLAQGPAAAAAIARQAHALSTPASTPSPDLAAPAFAMEVSPANANVSVHTSPQAASGAMVMAENNEERVTNESGTNSRSRGRGRGRGNANSSSNGMRTRDGASAPRTLRPYAPKYRSGAFACLMVLLDAYSEGVYRLSLRELQERGQQYCDEPFVRQKTNDLRTHYDGWSGMSKLTKEGLVARSGNPARFELTMSGLDIAKKSRAMGDDAVARIIQEYDQVNDKFREKGECGKEDDRPSLSFRGESTPGHRSNRRANRCTQREAELSGPTGEFALVHPEEFGCLEDEATRPRRNSRRASSSRTVGGRVNQSHVDRAIRVCERLERDGCKRNDCISLLRKIYDEGSFPGSDDRLYEVLSTRLWEQRIENQQRDRPQRTRRKILLRGNAIPNDDRAPTIRSVDTAEVTTSQPTQSTSIFSSDSRQLSSGPQLHFLRGNRNEVVPFTQVDARDFRSNAANSFSPNTQARVDPYLLNASHLTSATVPIFNEERFRAPLIQRAAASESVAEIVVSDDEDSIVEVDVNVEVSGWSTKQHSERRPRPSTCGSISEIQSTMNRYSRNPEGQDSTGANNVVNVVNDDILDLIETGPALPHSSQCANQQASGEHAQRGNTEHIVDGTWKVNPNSNSVTRSTAACNVILILDSMERCRRSLLSRADVSTMANVLSNHGVRCEVRPLPCGDALFVAQYEHGIEVMLDFLIERKTVNDFIASMRDGRVARQSYMMKQSQISRRIFVLEGELGENQDLRGKPEYMQNLANLEVCDAFYVKKTKDLKDTMWFYSSMFKRLCKHFEDKPLHIAIEGRTLFQDWNVRMKALKSGLTLEQLFSLQLCQLQGISTGTALAILKKGYNTPQALYRAFKNELDPQKREIMLVDSEEGITTRASKLLSRFFTATDYGTEVLQD